VISTSKLYSERSRSRITRFPLTPMGMVAVFLGAVVVGVPIALAVNHFLGWWRP